MMYVLIALVSAAVAGALAWYLTKVKLESNAASTVGRAELEAKRVVEEAEAQRRETVLETKDEAIRLRSEMDREVSNRRRELERVERRIVRASRKGIIRTAVSMSTAASAAIGMRETGPNAR